MQTRYTMFTPIMLGSGLFWTVTYLLIIRRGFRDQTYGMPLVALCANLAWEFIFSIVHPRGPIQRFVNIVWLLCDAVILYQALRFGPREFPTVPKSVFYLMFGLALATSFCAVLFMSYEFNDMDGVYAAFGQNLMMSVLFIAMLYHRRSLRGQSGQSGSVNSSARPWPRWPSTCTRMSPGSRFCCSSCSSLFWGMT